MTPGPARPPQPTRAPQQVRAGLAQVLTSILGPWWAGGHDTKSRALLAAATVLPAVLSLAQLRQPGVLPGAYDALVHRACRTRFPHPPYQTPSLGDHGLGGAWWLWPSRTQVEVSGQRGGWRFVRATTTWDQSSAPGPANGQQAGRLEVGNQLAQRLAPPTPDGPGQCGKAEGGLARVLATGPEGGAFTLEAQHVAQWARASGDDNALHTRPGLARRLGLEAGPEEVVAHGLLLAALSLAQAPLDGDTLSLRFRHPLGLSPEAPASLGVDPTGAVRAAGLVLLERR